ncbi:hypothetical protein ZHAS_00005767 [Anopheles sinensis]|uniref:Uncharacterized protein n=1 Tax=Anopheles sinensis TaxID=74873 RepID=A0A084VKB3_ANOSI|nr:hypothetical protein ZHAS_00005767 [Anopheles sinensis]
MSSLRKSASFRSRIPVRRSRLPHRRCTSPDQPLANTTTVHSHGSESSIATGHNEGGGGGQTRTGQQPRAWYDRSHCYSSSSYSSSDESYDSEAAPFQQLLNQSSAAARGGLMLLGGGNPAAPNAGSVGDQQGVDFPPLGLADGVQPFLHQQQLPPHPFGASACLSTSTDAMSLDGLLDCVSTGTFSCPPSPKSKSYLDSGDRGQLSGIDVSSYESLEKFSYALETLKISDSVHAQRNFHNSTTEPSTLGDPDPHPSHQLDEKQGSIFNGNGVQLRHAPDQIVPEVHEASPEEDDDLIKQRKLSDWYYIKTAPTKKPSSPFERRRAIGGRVQQQNEAARRMTTRFPPSPAPRASNPDVSGSGVAIGSEAGEQRHSERFVGAAGAKFSSPIPRPRRLPADVGGDQLGLDQDGRTRQVGHAVTKSASSSSVNYGSRIQLGNAMGTRGPHATRGLHSNTDLQQAGTRKAIAPDDSLGLALEDGSPALLLGAFYGSGGQDSQRFSPYCRRRNPQHLVPQWFPPPPPPPYHYPHHHHNNHHQHQAPIDQRNIYENFPPGGKPQPPEIPVPDVPSAVSARSRAVAAAANGTRPPPTLYGIEENEVFQYKLPLASLADKRPLPRPPLDSDGNELPESVPSGQQQQPTEKKSSLTRKTLGW